ncbi:RdgB/HAM1 family non-canonical purine NTP pyrophosphatase [Roseomonas haemaphysalidis]|uniref:dITP/XTP pyrophosphatase n=1 Tax=Roseomonas haemaphysalidis TaxID=2768162 RepID=A0ABS3KVT4_9PROT|nr:RdgB/HAM1 family non-canonical purine NTP pyrophosphatase [Roseomonas haemaphysalidis]MBO1081580.1 RdgB/HAM1 family non-canonical purine NTP pyrophosphatase [Roseomonas haemaphysalidis]
MSTHRRLEADRILLATHNAGKLKEVSAMLAEYGIAVSSAAELGLPVPDETETTFLGNATLKALAAARAANMVALADDSGFAVSALDGAPGVYTADWAEQPDGTRDYAGAMAKVEKLARHSPDRTAAFVCTLVLAWPDGHTEAFEGRCPGQWVWPPRGPGGFGYDPMFVPDGQGLTFAEMDTAAKKAIGHRGRAFALLAEGCLARG